MGWCFVESARRAKSNTQPAPQYYRPPKDATSVAVPEGTTSLTMFTFDQCSLLESVVIPKSVTKIDIATFKNLPKLSSIVVVDGNRFFDSRNNCNAIIKKRNKVLIAGCMNTVIPDTVEKIESSSFEGCVSLNSISIPKSVKFIEEDAFTNCSALTSIRIPESVEIFWCNAFSGCSALKKIMVAKRNKYFDSRNNCNAIIRKKDNTLISGCMNTVIPDSVEKIGYKAFCDCIGLSSVIIPHSVKHIHLEAFGNCTGLVSISLPDSTEIEPSAFGGCTNLQTITVFKTGCRAVKGILSYLPGALSKNSFIIQKEDDKSITFQRGGKPKLDFIEGLINDTERFDYDDCYLDKDLFGGRTDITSIILPEVLTCICDSAFEGCSALKVIDIPPYVTAIQDYAFKNCQALESIYLPGSVVCIGKGVFEGCTSLKTILVPKGRTVSFKKLLPEDLWALIVEVQTK